MKNNFVIATLIMQFVFLIWIAGTPATNHQGFVYAQDIITTITATEYCLN